MGKKKKPNRSNNAARQRRLDRDRSTEYERAKRAEDLKQIGPALSGLASKLKSIGEQVAANKAKAGVPASAVPASKDDVAVRGGLSKPDTQSISDTAITWTWRTTHDIRVDLMRFQDTGAFVLHTYTQVQNDIFKMDEVHTFAEALLSAYHYQNVWEEFVGEYVANGGKAVPPEPKPFQHCGCGEFAFPQEMGENPEAVSNGIVHVLGPCYVKDPSAANRLITDMGVMSAQGETLVPPREVSGDGTVLVDGMNPEWCLAGGQRTDNAKDLMTGKALCDQCGRRIKILKSGKFAPHKKVLK